ncbi:SDR family NAD(P)-dependent oxidoreductase [Halobium salinum]|uniref:SDR family NAD(P)-dependent oxidoreductase n=1 Tax=Halobium salinum TaxID=1364940 RepID=A0ABD5PCT7_9EURY|nr:SDR family NAD(P)-dependent oxidoreductase [Halobium salinum]
MRLDDETVLVTGGASGIGRATAARCADLGAHVVVTDVDESGGTETVDRIAGVDARKGGADAGRGGADAGEEGSAEFRPLDVTDREAFESVVDDVAAERGLDALVNNAGVGHLPAPVEGIDDAARERVLDVNVRGVWNGCAAALPVMKAQGSGAIVNVASLAGVVGSPHLGAYSLSKGAVVNFTRTVAAEAGGHGVRANAVCPGFVEGGLGAQFFETFDDPEAAKRQMVADYALERLGTVEEVADAVCYLASDAASFVTGEALMVDGGYSMQ